MATGLYINSINTKAEAEAIKGQEYAQTTVVIEVDEVNHIVTCEDFNGVLWQFYSYDEWFIGDIATMIMNNNDTPIIYDDIIVHIMYDGYIDGWVERWS